jgi:hypothetical protein
VAIPPKYKGRFIYHFTHLRNLPGIIADGLLSPNEQVRLGKTHKSIAIHDIQKRRAKMAVTSGPKGVVHDYVPFYFCSRSSMLLSVVNAKNVDQYQLIYLVAPLAIIARDDVVFTNASANTGTPPDFFSDPEDLDKLNWPAIESLKWSLPTDEGNQARMAEVLIARQFEVGDLTRIVVWNDHIKKEVIKIFDAAGVKPPEISFEGPPGTYHYFTGFYEGSRASIAAGPGEIKREYQAAMTEILDKEPRKDARFTNMSELLGALRKTLEAIPETNELIGLESDNEVHEEAVGDHTLSVVRNLKESLRFAALDDDAKRITELAAFLHDIGKGPKSRWVAKGGKQQVDANHPIKSVKMLVRIITEEVRDFTEDEVRVLAKLICYHDLVGDILGKGRHVQQLQEIAESERELDMIIALGMADVQAINARWYYVCCSGITALRERVVRNT